MYQITLGLLTDSSCSVLFTQLKATFGLVFESVLLVLLSLCILSPADALGWLKWHHEKPTQ